MDEGIKKIKEYIKNIHKVTKEELIRDIQEAIEIKKAMDKENGIKRTKTVKDM